LSFALACGRLFFHVTPAFSLTVDLRETLGFLNFFSFNYESPYKTMKNYLKKHLFRCDFNLKTKAGKRWILKQSCDKV
jgi:hypothetical protein